MFRILYFELRRLINIKNILAFFFLLLMSFYYVGSGGQEFRALEEETENFLAFERIKNERILSYEHLGAIGFRILYHYSPLTVFHNSPESLTPYQATIDTSEIIRIDRNQKAGGVFRSLEKINGFSGFSFYFFSILLLLKGAENFKTANSVKTITLKLFFKEQLIRIFLFSTILALIYYLNIVFAKIMGISFSGGDILVYTSVSFFSLLFFIQFYFVGLLISLFTSGERKLTFLYSFIIWVVLLILIPSVLGKYLVNRVSLVGSTENLNLNKMNVLMDFENEAKEMIIKLPKNDREARKKTNELLVRKYFSESYLKNNKLEKEHFRKLGLINTFFSKASIFIPSAYFSFIQNETSSQGYSNHLEFFKYIMKIRDEFMKFYFKKRYFSTNGKIESFIKDDENIYHANSRLPSNFWVGLGITCFYSLMLFGLCLWLFQKRKNKGHNLNKPFPIDAAEPGMAIHAQCRDTETRNRAYNHLVRQEGVIGLDNFKPDDLDIELPPRAIVPYFCYIFGVKDIQKVEENIKKIGVKDYRHFKRMTRAELEQEDLLKLYCAVILAKAEHYDSIVLNETLDKVSPEFERRFLELLDVLLTRPKRIVYFSKRYFGTASFVKLGEMISDDELELSNMELKRVSLR